MTIIFFFPKPIRKSRYKTFQLERLEKEGHDILIIDATKYFNNDQKLPQEKIFHNTFNISSRQDLDQLKLPEEKVLFVTADTHLNTSSSLLNKLIRPGDILLSYSNKAFAPVRLESNFVKKNLEKLINFFDDKLPLYKLKIYYKLYHKQIIPDYFLGSTTYLTPLKVKLTVRKDKRIFVHSDDMNEIIDLVPASFKQSKKTAVFVDQALPFQGKIAPGLNEDFFPETYVEDYYKKLNKSLELLKTKLDLEEIIIALHPSSGFFIDEINNYIPSFRKEIWKTAQLVRDSDYVIIHFSAAVGFAIYFDKPVIILSDSVMISNKAWKEAITYFNEKLGISLFNMDNIKSVESFDINQNLELYRDHKINYIKDNSIPENSYYYAIKKIAVEENLK